MDRRIKHRIGWVGIALAALLGAGCDTVNHTQYRLSGPALNEGGRATISAAEVAEVKETLKAVAERLRFEDRTEISIIPKTIVQYVQRETREPVRIGAWEDEGVIVVEVTHTPSAVGETDFYRRVREVVFTELQKRLGNRVMLEQKNSQKTRQAQPPAKSGQPTP